MAAPGGWVYNPDEGLFHWKGPPPPGYERDTRTPEEFCKQNGLDVSWIRPAGYGLTEEQKSWRASVKDASSDADFHMFTPSTESWQREIWEYTVRQGDTPMGIAALLCSSVEDIAGLNPGRNFRHVAEETCLQTGEKLKVRLPKFVWPASKPTPFVQAEHILGMCAGMWRSTKEEFLKYNQHMVGMTEQNAPKDWIPIVVGRVHTIKDGETPETVANQYLSFQSWPQYDKTLTASYVITRNPQVADGRHWRAGYRVWVGPVVPRPFN